ncbi:MAG: class I SAM-dependent methyltransferase [Candidatus Acidiferrales bacterium]
MPRLARTILPRIRKSIAERGIVASVLRSFLLPVHLYREYRDARAAGRNHERSEFDAAYGVETDEGGGGRTYLSDLEIPSRNWIYGVDYIAIEPERFRELVSQLNIRFEDFAFVDFGSGKGRALLLAAEFPFKRIVGIEFAPELHAIAQRNIRSYGNPKRRCANIESICMDFSEYELPDEPCVLYFFDPCGGSVLAKTLENIRRSLEQRPRTIYLLYVAPPQEGVERAADFLAPVARDAARNFCIFTNALPRESHRSQD